MIPISFFMHSLNAVFLYGIHLVCFVNMIIYLLVFCCVSHLTELRINNCIIGCESASGV